MQDVQVTFDDDYKVRVLDSDSFKQTEALAEECKQFVARIKELNTTVHALTEVLAARSDKIEQAKLRAIGQRMLVESETENCTRRKAELRALIGENQAQLERLRQQYASLERVEAEQRILIEKLSSSEA